MEDQGDYQALTRALERFSDKADKLLASGNTNTARIEVNAGGVGVWIATTCCLVVMVVSMFLGLWVVDLSRKVSDLNDYLAAIYMQAPHLKPDHNQEQKNSP